VHEADVPEVKDALSRADVDAAIAALTAKEKLILLRGAELFCYINGFDSPDDLLQEALTRAIEGQRKCPRSLPIVPFIWSSMSSIADAAAKRKRRSRIDAFAEPEDAEEEEQLDGTGEEVRDPERLAAARDALAKVEALFQDDVEVSVLIEELANGLKGEELRASLGLTDTELDTIRKRMHRKCKELAKPWRENE
jgi:DNA-directed RNA polymerase specialized sigma24 family protein